MKKKLKSRTGFSLSEMLMAVAVLGLFTLAVSVGISAAMPAYRQSTAYAEASVLSSTLAEAVTDELRYARDVVLDGESLKSYRSAVYGPGVSLYADGQGKIAVGASALQLLGSGAYAGCSADVSVTYEAAGGCFRVALGVSRDGTELSRAEFAVRPLNPVA